VEDPGFVAAYASSGADVEPAPVRGRRRTGRITTPAPETVSAAEFEQMKRDLVEPGAPSRRSSTLTKPASRPGSGTGAKATRPAGTAAPSRKAAKPATETPPAPATKPTVGNGAEGNGQERAPDVAENDGVAPVQKPKRTNSKQRNRRHGRRR